MGEFDVRGSELKKLIKLARKQPLAFAYNPGSGPKDDYFGMDKRKPAKVVGKKAREEGAGKKAAFGMASVEGKILSLRCEKEIPAIAKKLKKYLKSEKVTMNVQILGADGSVLEEDIEDGLPDDPDLMEEATEVPESAQREAPTETTEEDGLELSEVTNELKALAQKIQAMDSKAAAPFVKIYKQLVAFLKEGDGARAKAGIEKVSAAIHKVSGSAPKPGAPENPEAVKWQDTQPKIEALLEQAKLASESAAAKLDGAWSQVTSLAEAGQFDKALAAAGKLVPTLRKLADQTAPDTAPQEKKRTKSQEDVPGTKPGKDGTEDTGFERDKEILTKRLAAMSAGLGVARDVLPDRASEISKLEATITGLDSPEGLGAAREAADTLQQIADQGAQRAREIKTALEEVDRVEKFIQSMRDEANERLGGSAPDSLTNQLDQASDGLADKESKDPEAIVDSTRQAFELLQKTESELAELAAERATWETRLGLFEPRVSALENHAQKEAEPVKAKITEVKDGLEEAKELAGAHKYKEAAEALLPLAAKCLEGENYADDCAHYETIKADRKERIEKLLADYPLAGDKVHDLVKGTIRIINEDYEAAKALAAASPPDYTGAMKIMQPLAKRIQDAKWRGERADSYADRRKKLKEYIDERAAQPEVVEVKSYLQKVRDLHADSDVGKTKSFLKSLSILERADSLDTALWRAIKLKKKYDEAKEEAEDAIKDLKDLDGHEGIKDHITRLEDAVKRAGEVIKEKEDGKGSEYLHAAKLCDDVVSQFDDLEEKAEKYKEYLDAKDDLKDAKDAWDDKGKDKVQNLINQLDKLVQEADNAVSDENYDLAKGVTKKAEELANKIKDIIDNAVRVAGILDNVKTGISSAGEGDIAGLVDRVGKLVAQAEKLDTDNIYSTETNNAGQLAQGATAKANDDLSGAKSDLESARQQLEDAIEKILETRKQKSVRDDLKSTYDGIVATDRGDALKDDTDDIDQAFSDSKDASDRKDLATSANEIGKIAAKLDKLRERAEDYDDYKDLLDGDIDDCNTWFDTADGAYGTPKNKVKVGWESYKKKRDEAATEAGNKEWKKALELLKKADKAGDLADDMFDDYQKAVDYRKEEITDELSPVDTEDLVKDQYAAMKPKIEKVDTLIEECQFDQAKALIDSVGWEIYAAQDTLTRDKEIKPKRDAAVQAIDMLKAETCLAVEHDLARAQEVLKEVDAEIAANTYPNAIKIVESIAEICKDPIRIGKEYKLYAATRAAADKAVEDLRKDHGDDEAVGLRLARLDARLTKLNGLEAKREFNTCKPVAQAIADDAQEAAAAAVGQARLKQVSDMLKEAGPTETQGFDKQLAAIRGAAATLSSHLGAASPKVTEDLERINRLLDEAETEFTADANVPSARDKLARASAALLEANTEAQQFAQMGGEIKAMTERSTALKVKYTEPKGLAQLFDAANRMVIAARGSADKSLYDTAMNQINDAGASLDKAELIGAEHEKYVETLGKVKPRVDGLNGHDARYSVVDLVNEARLYLSAAGEFADALKPKEAIENLNTCANLCIRAEVKADMHANEDLDEDKLKELLATPQGSKQLDEIFKTLDPQVQRKACKKALELRFGIELKQYEDKDGTIDDDDEDEVAPNVTRLFSVLSSLDDEFTSDNPSVALIKRIGTESGTSSFGLNYKFDDKRLKKKIKLRVGRAEMPEEEVIGQEWEIGEVDENCKPVDDTPAQMFNWTTLHEIGHAVDDKYGVMDRKGKDTQYGGWRAYGGDVSEIAEAAEGKFDFPKDYIAAYLANPKGNYPKPDPKNNLEPEEWKQRRLNAEAWCDSIREGKSIWYSAASAKRVEIGGRVYQEAYGGDWVSYDLDARKQGVTGYQFRAPGEWFAELFAAFHTGKMNPEHPARDWLEKDMSK